MSGCSSRAKEPSKFNPPEVEQVLRDHKDTGFSNEDVLSFYAEFKAIAKGRSTINSQQFMKLLNELNVD